VFSGVNICFLPFRLILQSQILEICADLVFIRYTLLLLLLLVWHSPLGVRSTKRRHQSPEWTILSHSYCLIQGEIVRPQVLLDSLHPRSMRTFWWSPPVLRRGSSYDTPGICLIWHSRNVAEQRKTPCLDNSQQAWLPGCPSHLVIPHMMVPFDS